MILLAAATFIIFFIIAVKRPVLALFSASALLPAYLLRFTIFGLPSTILEVIIWAIVLGYFIFHRDFSLLKIRLQKIKLPLAIFFTASIISICVSPDLFSAIGKWRAFFLESILFFLVFLAAIKDKRDFEKIIFGLSLSTFYLSAISIGQKFFHLPNPFLDDAARASSVFPQPNMLGMYLAPIIILMIGQFIKSLNHKIIKSILYYGINIFLSFSAIVFAQSMGAIVGVIAGIIIFCFLQNKKSAMISLAALFISLAIYILLFPNNIFIEKLFFGNWSGVVRLQMWRETWEMLKDNWFFGAGISGYATKIIPYHTSREWMDVFLYPHNIIFNFWSELGILGFAAFAWLLERFGKTCYHLLKRERLLAITAIAAMSVLIIHGLVDVPYFKNDLSILFWIIYSIPLVI